MFSDEQLRNMSVEELGALERRISGDLDINSMSDDELKNLTVEQLEDLERQLSKQETPHTGNIGATDPGVYTDLSEYYGDRMQRGLTATPSLVGALYRTLIKDPFTEGAAESWEELYQRFGENYMAYQEGYQDLFGMEVDQTGKRAPNDVHRYLGTGVEIMADPATAFAKLGIKLSNVLSKDTAKKLAAREATLGTIGVTAEGGGDIGAQMEKAFTGEDTGKGRMIGSIATPIATSFVSRPAIKTAADMGGKVYSKIKEIKSNPAKANEAFATTFVKNILGKIKAENPNIEEIIKDLNSIGVKWDAGNFPLLAAASEGTAKSQMIHLARTNSDYRRGFIEEFERVVKLIDNNADKLFGTRYAELPISETQISKGLQKRTQFFIKKRQEVDKKIEDLQEGFEPTMSASERGQKIAQLVEERQKLVRQEMEPLYKEIEELAGQSTIPKEAVSDIYDFIKKAGLEDLFNTLPKVERDAFKVLTPIEVLNKKGKKIQIGTDQFNRPIYQKEFRPLTFQQFDSLKRAINKAKRNKNLANDERRKLITFDKEVGDINLETGERTGLRSYLPEEVDLKLREVDKLYYEKLGVPFDVEAIAQIGKKRYYTEVSDVILKNTESVDQFLNAVGKEGVQVARDGMIAKILKESIDSDGVLNGAKLKKSLNKNESVIDAIPGMSDEIAAIKQNADYLFQRMATLDDALKIEQKKVGDHFLMNSGYDVPYTKLVETISNNPKTRFKFLKDVKKLDKSTQQSVMNNVRREFIESLKKRPGAYDYLVDPKNKKLLTDIFGPGYQDNLKAFGRVVDTLANLDTKKLNSVIMKENTDIVSKTLPGVDLPYVQSNLRDRISSIAMKITRIFSKMQQFKTGKEMDKQVYELLMHPDGMRKFQNITAGMKFTVEMTDMRKLWGTMRELFPIYLYGGLKSAVSHQGQETLPISEKIQ